MVTSPYNIHTQVADKKAGLHASLQSRGRTLSSRAARRMRCGRVTLGGGAYGGQKTHAPRPVLVRLPRLLAEVSSSFPFGWPRGPGVSVRAAGLNVEQGMFGPRSDSQAPTASPRASGRLEGAHPQGLPGAGPPIGRAPSVPAHLRPEVTKQSALTWGGGRSQPRAGGRLAGPPGNLNFWALCRPRRAGSTGPFLISIKILELFVT